MVDNMDFRVQCRLFEVIPALPNYQLCDLEQVIYKLSVPQFTFSIPTL